MSRSSKSFMKKQPQTCMSVRVLQHVLQVVGVQVFPPPAHKLKSTDVFRCSENSRHGVLLRHTFGWKESMAVGRMGLDFLYVVKSFGKTSRAINNIKKTVQKVQFLSR